MVSVFIGMATMGAIGCWAFFNLYHPAAHCTESGDKLSGPSAHTDHLALNYFSNHTPVHEVDINVSEACLPGPVCLCCFPGHVV